MEEYLFSYSSGYYSYLRRGLSRRHEENHCLVEKIKQIWHEVRGVYGSPRVTVELQAQGFVCGENRIARLMRENGIKARTKKKFKVTTKSDHNLPIAQDLGERDFSAFLGCPFFRGNSSFWCHSLCQNS